VEFAFQDQYLGRNEMWRLGQHLIGKCVYVDQEISFMGVIAAKVTSIYVGGHRVGVGLSCFPHFPVIPDLLTDILIGLGYRWVHDLRDESDIPVLIRKNDSFHSNLQRVLAVCG
jgi:hypothetical protein